MGPTGVPELINYVVGQVVGSMNQLKSVRSVIEELVRKYADTMERLGDQVHDQLRFASPVQAS
jgi:hypothetical protein